MTGQDQHHPGGQGDGACYRPQGQVWLMLGQGVGPPHAGRGPVPRQVTGMLAHCPYHPRAINARAPL
jgi:hypothetical protein